MQLTWILICVVLSAFVLGAQGGCPICPQGDKGDTGDVGPKGDPGDLNVDVCITNAQTTGSLGRVEQNGLRMSSLNVFLENNGCAGYTACTPFQEAQFIGSGTVPQSECIVYARMGYTHSTTTCYAYYLIPGSYIEMDSLIECTTELPMIGCRLSSSFSRPTECYSPFCWMQQGADIDGEAAVDYSGSSVSINAAGDVVAIGAIGNDGNGAQSGHVRVYEFSGGNWVKLGADIDGEAAEDGSGVSVSVNAAGDVVAIGATGNDGNGIDSGHVRVYEFSGDNWVQLGADIDGEKGAYLSDGGEGEAHVGDNSGWSVSINAAGDVVAIGGILDGIESGHVRVFHFSGGNWVQLGGDIDGEATAIYSDYKVSLNAAGDVVAIGVRGSHVRVYQFIGGVWVQLGADIDGESAVHYSGYLVSLNAAGDVVATSNRQSSVRVYHFFGGVWVQLGADIDERLDYTSSISINAAGDAIAIAVQENAGGHMHVYKFTGGHWIYQDVPIDGRAVRSERPYSVSMNADGDIVAIGVPTVGNGDESGHVSVYVSAGCDEP